MSHKDQKNKKNSNKLARNKKDERVSGRRVPINLLVDYKSGGNYLFDFCKDLGSGGVFIKTDDPLTSGESIDLTFTIPDSNETFEAKGKVMWSQSKISSRPELVPGMGIQFVNFSSSDRQRLEEFVVRYSSTRIIPTKKIDKSA